MRHHQTILEWIIALIVFLFLYTGISKFLDPITFRSSLSMSPLLEHFAGIIALLLPIIEITIVVLLIIPRSRLWGLRLSAGLLSVFTIYLIGMVAFSKHLPCGCGGVISQLSWKGHILFNIFFVALSFYGIRLQKNLQKVNMTNSNPSFT
jgi:uncharacterized membrane protein YphA (DoxX/SURF4 family)